MINPLVWLQNLYDALAQSTHVSPAVFGLVFLGGVASALSPCFTPVLAMFGGYIGGYANNMRKSLSLGIPFVIGSTVTLAVVGAFAAWIGKAVVHVFTGYELNRWIPGVIGLVMGLQLLGVLRLNLPALPAITQKRPATSTGALLLGLPFGLVVTPCTIPIFLSIVTFVAFTASTVSGAALMVCYALGRGTVLISLAIIIAAGKARTASVARMSRFVERACGAVILVASAALLIFYNQYLALVMRWMPPS